MNKKEEFYVGVTDPLTARRNLLETSKSLIQILQKFEGLKGLKHEKREAVDHMHGLIREISIALADIKHNLPDYRISDLPKKKETVPKPLPLPKKVIAPPRKIVKPVPEPEPKPKRASELDKLERELGSIEAKLKEL